MEKYLHRDFLGGVLVILLGLGSIISGFGFHIGSLEHMGSGYFPVAVGLILALVGLGIAGPVVARNLQDSPLEMPDWRGYICVLGGLIGFMIFGKIGGLIPGTFAVVFIAAFGDKKNTVKQAFLLACGMCVLSAIVFGYLLETTIPLFGWR